MKTFLVALLCALPSIAFAARPAPPLLTVNANQIKQLDFAWQPLTGVTKYQLWFKANDDAAWVKYFEKPAPRTSMTMGVSVHLLEWPEARYQLKACNAEGCTTSNTVRVNHDEKLLAMGYFKPDTSTGLRYGGMVALSADGNTLAVQSGEPANGIPDNLFIYVYRKSGAGWRREARLTPSTRNVAPYLGDSLALSGDGNLLAVGTEDEDGPGDSLNSAGAVYLFRRSGSTWSEAQKIPGDGAGANFGKDVKLDDAGRMLVVSAQRFGQFYEAGTLQVYRAAGATSPFVHDTTVRVPMTNGNANICSNIALSGNGERLLRRCADGTTRGGYLQALDSPGFGETARIPLGEEQRGPDLNYDGTVFILQSGGAAVVYRLGTGGWAGEARLTAYTPDDYGGPRRVAISRDGKFAAIGSPGDIAAGRGPIFPPYQTAPSSSGAVFIYERRGSGWVLRRFVKPGSTGENQDAGWVVALGDNGRTLAVGAPRESSGATGIDGDRDDESAPETGAVLRD